MAEEREPKPDSIQLAESHGEWPASTPTTIAARQWNVTEHVMTTHITPTAAAAFVDMEQARAEAERYRAEAERFRSEAAVRVAEQETRQREAVAKQAEKEAEERTKRECEATAQARESTTQSRHRVVRVLISSVALGGGVLGCALVPAAAGAIATMVGGVLTVAVGGSYAVEFASKRREAKAPTAEQPAVRNEGKSPPEETSR